MPTDYWLKPTSSNRDRNAPTLLIGYATTRHFVWNPRPYTTSAEWLLFLRKATTTSDASNPPYQIWVDHPLPAYKPPEVNNITFDTFRMFLSHCDIGSKLKPSGNFWSVHYADDRGHIFTRLPLQDVRKEAKDQKPPPLITNQPQLQPKKSTLLNPPDRTGYQKFKQRQLQNQNQNQTPTPTQGELDV